MPNAKIPTPQLPVSGGPRSGAISLRLTQEETAKLRFIAEHTPKSQHQFVLDVLLPALDAEFKRLTK